MDGLYISSAHCNSYNSRPVRSQPITRPVLDEFLATALSYLILDYYLRAVLTICKSLWTRRIPSDSRDASSRYLSTRNTMKCVYILPFFSSYKFSKTIPLDARVADKYYKLLFVPRTGISVQNYRYTRTNESSSK
jgi:hypothetical protein